LILHIQEKFNLSSSSFLYAILDKGDDVMVEIKNKIENKKYLSIKVKYRSRRVLAKIIGITYSNFQPTSTIQDPHVSLHI